MEKFKFCIHLYAEIKNSINFPHKKTRKSEKIAENQLMLSEIPVKKTSLDLSMKSADNGHGVRRIIREFVGRLVRVTDLCIKHINISITKIMVCEKL